MFVVVVDDDDDGDGDGGGGDDVLCHLFLFLFLVFVLFYFDSSFSLFSTVIFLKQLIYLKVHATRHRHACRVFPHLSLFLAQIAMLAVPSRICDTLWPEYHFFVSMTSLSKTWSVLFSFLRLAFCSTPLFSKGHRLLDVDNDSASALRKRCLSCCWDSDQRCIFLKTEIFCDRQNFNKKCRIRVHWQRANFIGWTDHKSVRYEEDLCCMPTV